MEIVASFFAPCHPLSNIVHRFYMALYVDDTNFQSSRVCSVKSINASVGAAQCRRMMEKMRVSLHGTFAMKEKFIYCWLASGGGALSSITFNRLKNNWLN